MKNGKVMRITAGSSFFSAVYAGLLFTMPAYAQNKDAADVPFSASQKLQIVGGSALEMTSALSMIRARATRAHQEATAVASPVIEKPAYKYTSHLTPTQREEFIREIQAEVAAVEVRLQNPKLSASSRAGLESYKKGIAFLAEREADFAKSGLAESSSLEVLQVTAPVSSEMELSKTASLLTEEGLVGKGIRGAGLVGGALIILNGAGYLVKWNAGEPRPQTLDTAKIEKVIEEGSTPELLKNSETSH